MRFMVMVKADAKIEGGGLPSQAELEAMTRFNQELVDAGIMLAGEGLHPTSKGVRVRFEGSDRVVTDGPFPETKEVVAGYWLWELGSMEEAIEWARRAPMFEGAELEIRPLFEDDDLGEAFTPELREREARMRARIEARRNGAGDPFAAQDRLTPCLWFDSEAEAAAAFYTQVFPNSRIVRVNRYNGAGTEIHGRPEGSVMTVDLELDGQSFVALNGGPHFQFNEAVSFMVHCDSQDEVDHYWERLGDGGDPSAQQCGWLKDRFGVSWQVVPRGLNELVQGPDYEASQRAMNTLLRMKKIDLRALEKAYAG
jgi:predicted 3-demethylubiquinone-9 3-methyltransferase (glyoxalase superfamily)